MECDCAFFIFMHAFFSNPMALCWKKNKTKQTAKQSSRCVLGWREKKAAKTFIRHAGRWFARISLYLYLHNMRGAEACKGTLGNVVLSQ